jgi:serine/threonine protein kinase
MVRKKKTRMEVVNAYGVIYPLTCVLAKGGHAIIYRTVNPQVVAKVEIQKGPGQLALLRKEQEFMRNFKGVTGLAHSLDVYWNIKYYKSEVLNVMYMPYYPFALEELQCSLIDIARQLKNALLELHNRGLVHRDVNPGNIRGKTANELVLIDFGLCAVESRLPNKTKVATGTMPFISESVVEGNRYRFKDDMVSACKVIHYLSNRDHWLTTPCPNDIQVFFLGDPMMTT